MWLLQLKISRKVSCLLYSYFVLCELLRDRGACQFRVELQVLHVELFKSSVSQHLFVRGLQCIVKRPVCAPQSVPCDDEG